MAKSVSELKKAGQEGRTLADLKSLDTSTFIKWVRKTTIVDGKVCDISGVFEPIEGRWVKIDWLDKTFKSKETGKDETKTTFQYFLEQGPRIRPLESPSLPLKITMQNSNALGKMVRITRTGEMKDTKYSVEITGE